MITFSNTIKLITSVWVTSTLVGYCETNYSNLNCSYVNRYNHSQEFSMLNKCPKGYQDKQIIQKCEFLINRDEPFDTKLYWPAVSNDTTRDVYWNEYCATCNNRTSPNVYPLSWNRYFNNNSDKCEKVQRRIQRSEINDIHNLSQIIISDGVKLKIENPKDPGEFKFECSINETWPIHLTYYVIPCLYENFLAGQNTRLEQCQYYEKTGRICSKMRLYMNGLNFHFKNKSEEIEFNDALSKYKDFTLGQYHVETEYPGMFYICHQTTTIYGGKYSVKILIVVISSIFIIITLGINSNQRYLQRNNINKFLYLYMIRLVPINIILLLIYLSYPVPCVALYLAQFLWVYHFLCSMFIYMELLLLAYCTLHNCIVNCLHYLVYCIFGLAIPLVLPFVFYFGILVLNENYKENLSQPDALPSVLQYTCPIIPDHLGVSCTSFENFGSKYYSEWLETIISLKTYSFISALFLLISSVILYQSSDARWIPYRDDFIVVVKMASIMGMHWVLFKIYEGYGNDHSLGIFGISFGTLCQLSIDFHGIIVFIVFGAKKCIGFIMKMRGCKNKSVSQEDGEEFTEIS